YEMATGKQAFAGETRAAIHEAILERAPVPLRELNSAVSSRLGKIISKALEKDRNHRYQTASEIVADLTALRSEVNGSRSPVIDRGLPWPLLSAAVATLVLVAAISWIAKRRPTSTPGLDRKSTRLNSSH